MWSLSFRIPHLNPIFIRILYHACHTFGQSQYLWFNYSNNGWEGVQTTVSHYAVSSSLLLLPLLDLTALLSTLFSNTSVYAALSMWKTIFNFHTLMLFCDKQLCNCRLWQTTAWDKNEQTYIFHTCSSPRMATILHGLKHVLKRANAVSCFVFERS